MRRTIAAIPGMNAEAGHDPGMFPRQVRHHGPFLLIGAVDDGSLEANRREVAHDRRPVRRQWLEMKMLVGVVKLHEGWAAAKSRMRARTLRRPLSRVGER